MARNGYDRFSELVNLLGEVPTEVLTAKARMLFPQLVHDPQQLAELRRPARPSTAGSPEPFEHGLVTRPKQQRALKCRSRVLFLAELDVAPSDALLELV